MKKSILALLIASTLALSACEDKQTEQKLAQAEQNISQLKTDLEKTKQQLADSQQLLEKNKAQIPSLMVKSVEILKKEEQFKRDKPKNEDEFAITESHIDYDISGVETGYQWLDDLLYQQLLKEFTLEEMEDKAKQQEFQQIANPAERYKAVINYFYNLEKNDAQKFEVNGMEHQTNLTYMGQRNNILSFNIFHNVYTGGAHGMYWNNYINIDTDTKSIVSLNDLVSPEKQAQLKQLLWESYKDYVMQRSSEPVKEEELFTNKQDFSISEEFSFSPDGVEFYYPPYAIGSYAEGEIKLVVYWQQIKDIITKKYLW